MNLDEVKELDHEFVMQTYGRMNVAFEKGIGARLFDEHGRDYIDFGSGIGVSSVGYGNQRMVEALITQAQKLLHTSNLYYLPNQAILAQKLVELSGYDMSVFFANSGAEANECMIKFARKYGEMHFPQKRYKIITLQSSFHGRTLATLKATGQEALHRYFDPFPDGFVIAKDLQDIYTKIDEETCGVMLELIQGEGGIRAWPKDEIKALQEYLREKKILLLVDEVQSGAYRTGEFLASQFYGITPDAISLAKGMGGGIPIGAVMSGHKDILLAGDHGSTFGGNPLSTRVSLEVLEILQEEKESGRLDETIRFFNAKLDELMMETDLFVRKSGFGLMLGLEMKGCEGDCKTHQKDSNKRYFSTPMDLIARALEEGVILLRSGKNIIRFLPPLMISKEEIIEGFERLKRIF